MKKINNISYTTFNDIWNDDKLLSDKERAEIEFEVSIIGKLIEAREKRGFTQKQLAEKSGLKQSAIARLEGMRATPKVDTLLKVLDPLGYTLAIVPKKQLKVSKGKIGRVKRIGNQ